MGVRLGRYVQHLRDQRSESIRHLGRVVGVSPSHLSLIESGCREASITVLYRIVQSLEGDFVWALRLLASDAGVPDEVLSRLSPSTHRTDRPS